MSQEQIIARRPLSTCEWILFSLVLGIAIVLAIWMVIGQARRMRPADSLPRAAGLATGSDVKAVVRIDSITGNQFVAALLRRQTDSVYCLLPRGPDSEISVAFGPKTSIVMGKTHDIAKDAVVQVAGKVDEKHIVQAAQIVILTGYVRVPEKLCQQ